MRLHWVTIALSVSLMAGQASALQPRERPARDGAQPTSRNKRRPKVKKRRPPKKATPKPTKPAEDIDRTVIRWYARGRGGATEPKFITARELAFEARLEALTAHSSPNAPYTNKDIRSAIQRHISESMLASLPVSPKPTPKQVASYAEAARNLIAQRIAAELEDPAVEKRRLFGLKKLDDARRAEGISREELDALLRRRARASWYLDRMVAPMLKPTDLDLREAHLRGETPFTAQPFDEVKGPIERWFVSARLAAALDRYFRNVRSRVHVVVIHRPPRAEPTKSRSPRVTKPPRKKASLRPRRRRI